MRKRRWTWWAHCARSGHCIRRRHRSRHSARSPTALLGYVLAVQPRRCTRGMPSSRYSRRAYESASRWSDASTWSTPRASRWFALSGSHIALQDGMPLFVAIIYGRDHCKRRRCIARRVSTEIPTLFRVGRAVRHRCICRLRGLRRAPRAARASAHRGKRRIHRDCGAASDIDLARHRPPSAALAAHIAAHGRAPDRGPSAEHRGSRAENLGVRYFDVVLRRRKSIKMNWPNVIVLVKYALPRLISATRFTNSTSARSRANMNVLITIPERRHAATSRSVSAMTYASRPLSSCRSAWGSEESMRSASRSDHDDLSISYAVRAGDDVPA